MGSRMSFGGLEPQGQRRKARREGLPERMDAAVPWGRWRALVGPSCHSQARGRHARGAETMLRMCLLQAMLGLSGGGAEDAVLDSRAMQRFMRLGPMREQVPDATALAKLRHAPVGEGGASCRAGPGHMGVAERPEVASGPHPSPMRRTTARKPSAIEGLDCALPAERGIESRKASVRSGAEHPSLIAKRRSGHLKTRCRGVRKSSCMPCMAFAPADPAVRIPAGRSLASRPEAA